MATIFYVLIALISPAVLIWLAVGPKLLLVKSVWVVAGALLVISGFMLLGGGVIAVIAGLFFASLGVMMVAAAVRTYFKEHAKQT